MYAYIHIDLCTFHSGSERCGQILVLMLTMAIPMVRYDEKSKFEKYSYGCNAVLFGTGYNVNVYITLTENF